MAKQIINSNAKIIVGSSFNYGTLVKAIEITKKSLKIIFVKLNAEDSIPTGAISFDELMNPKNTDLSILKVHDINPDDCVYLPYSSGTTGMPKGVMLSHNNICHNAVGIHSVITKNKSSEPYTYTTTSTHQEILPCILPFFHIYGFATCLLAKLAIGVKAVTLPKFQPDTFINVLEQEKPTVLHAVPPMSMF